LLVVTVVAVFGEAAVLAVDALAVVAVLACVLLLADALVFGAALAAAGPAFAGALTDALLDACGVSVVLGLCARKGTMA
jgi:hypothetical protein